MRKFVLEASDGRLTLLGESPASTAPYEAWKYAAEIGSDSLSAKVNVSDHMPTRFAEFFSILAHNWKGWIGTMEYESLEPTLKLSARHNGKSSVMFAVLLRAGACENLNWSASLSLRVDIGHLQQLAHDAHRFTLKEV